MVSKKEVFGKRVKITVFVILLIIVLLVLVREYSEFRFLVGEGLVLRSTINPLFVLREGETANISVTVNTNNDLFCKSFCEYSLVNLEDNSIAENGSALLVPNEALNFEYEYFDKNKKEGQTLFVFETTCSNLKSLLCVRQTGSATLTNLIVVNYELSEEEKTLKEEARIRLISLLNRTVELDFQSQEIKAKSQALSLQYNDDDLVSYFEKIEEIKILWNNKNYLGVKDKLDTLGNFSLEPYYFILDDFDELNKTSEELKLINSELKKIEKNSFALRNETIMTMFGDSVEIYNEANNYILGDFNKSKGLVSQINISELVYVYNNFEDSMIFRVKDAVSEQYGVSCDLGSELCGSEYYHGSWNDFCLFVSNNDEVWTDLILEINQSFCYDIDYPRIKKLNEFVYEFEFKPRILESISDNFPECCVFNECEPCCTDCSDNPGSYPVIFVHGHAFNKESAPDYSLGHNFIALQDQLQKDGFINAGILTPGSSVGEVDYGEWGRSGRPVTVRLTYYYNFYQGEDGFVAVPQKNENIETYSIRLREFIKLVKFRTGKNRVILVAHSMGGLVARSYVDLFGGQDVYKMILLATPNRGIDAHIASLCPVFGEEKECNDMKEGSVFLNKLNTQKEDVDIYVVTATGCEMKYGVGDGIVLEENVPLDYATNFVVQGECNDLLKNDLHSAILDPAKYPEVYDILKKILKEE